MSDSEEYKQIELTIDQCKESIELLDALDRLRKNADWKFLIETNYLEKEASRLVLAKADPALQEDAQQEQLDKMIHGVGWFRQYLHKIIQMGLQAKRTLPEHEQTREEILSEN